ncbi:MAG: hypothetical protein KKG92_04330 [Gammaproteobacteria bacterium]|nr:hypothetical protein [Gammaproteobacteria bacterium]
MIETGLANVIAQAHTATAATAQDLDFGIQLDIPAEWNEQCQRTTTGIYRPPSAMVLTENRMAGC